MEKVQIVGIISSIFLLLFVLELVRRRRLREEYAWLWLITALAYLFLTVFVDVTLWFRDLIGAQSAVSAFTFVGFFFLLMICIQFSVRLSRLTNRNKNLAQHVAILDSEIRELRRKQSENMAEEGETVSAEKVHQLS